jgi:hypothetical protein
MGGGLPDVEYGFALEMMWLDLVTHRRGLREGGWEDCQDRVYSASAQLSASLSSAPPPTGVATPVSEDSKIGTDRVAQLVIGDCGVASASPRLSKGCPAPTTTVVADVRGATSASNAFKQFSAASSTCGASASRVRKHAARSNIQAGTFMQRAVGLLPRSQRKIRPLPRSMTSCI